MTRAGLLLLVVALVSVGCTLATPFNPDSQPCEPGVPVEQQCTDGYVCVTEGQPDGGICKKLAEE
ncbi:MAG: hypothetical protein ACO1OB_26980 [Archangium sp.]